MLFVNRILAHFVDPEKTKELPEIIKSAVKELTGSISDIISLDVRRADWNTELTAAMSSLIDNFSSFPGEEAERLVTTLRANLALNDSRAYNDFLKIVKTFRNRLAQGGALDRDVYEPVIVALDASYSRVIEIISLYKEGRDGIDFLQLTSTFDKVCAEVRRSLTLLDVATAEITKTLSKIQETCKVLNRALNGLDSLLRYMKLTSAFTIGLLICLILRFVILSPLPTTVANSLSALVGVGALVAVFVAYLFIWEKGPFKKNLELSAEEVARVADELHKVQEAIDEKKPEIHGLVKAVYSEPEHDNFLDALDFSHPPQQILHSRESFSSVREQAPQDVTEVNAQAAPGGLLRIAQQSVLATWNFYFGTFTDINSDNKEVQHVLPAQ